MDINLFKNPSSLNHAVESFNVIKINEFFLRGSPKFRFNWISPSRPLHFVLPFSAISSDDDDYACCCARKKYKIDEKMRRVWKCCK